MVSSGALGQILLSRGGSGQQQEITTSRPFKIRVVHQQLSTMLHKQHDASVRQTSSLSSTPPPAPPAPPPPSHCAAYSLDEEEDDDEH